jgi:hypothetical protein
MLGPYPITVARPFLILMSTQVELFDSSLSRNQFSASAVPSSR